MPTAAYSLGNKAPAKSAITATIKKLTHHGERSNTANSDFSDILNFTNHSGQLGQKLDCPSSSVCSKGSKVKGQAWPMSVKACPGIVQVIAVLAVACLNRGRIPQHTFF